MVAFRGLGHTATERPRDIDNVTKAAYQERRDINNGTQAFTATEYGCFDAKTIGERD